MIYKIVTDLTFWGWRSLRLKLMTTILSITANGF